jgi:DNA-binding CsgD family transcriptional regulator
VGLLADAYRRFFKLAVANPPESELDPHEWTLAQLQPAVNLTSEWIRDWYILACDGENQWVQRAGSVPFVPGQNVSITISATAPPSDLPGPWRVPAWLFQISVAYFGIGLMKNKHVPQTDSEARLGAAHTRLLLGGARRVFVWELQGAIETVRNEELAAAGAIPAQVRGEGQTGAPKKPKHWLKGIQGLTRKVDLSEYKQGLTEKQELAFTLKYEYLVGPAELAGRMGIDRKTAREHIEAADRKIGHLRSNEKRKANRARSKSDY